MEAEEILKEKPTIHYGYQLTEIGKTVFDPAEIGVEPLKAIPHKITSWIDRNKIDKVFKCQLGKQQHEAYYIILSIDGTLFHVQ